MPNVKLETETLTSIAQAIVTQAASDYRSVISKRNDAMQRVTNDAVSEARRIVAKGYVTQYNNELDRIERFFDSPYGCELCLGLNDVILEKLQAERAILPT